MMTSRQIQCGELTHVEKFFSYISASYCPINAKFGMKKQSHLQTHVVYDLSSKFRKFKTVDGH